MATRFIVKGRSGDVYDVGADEVAFEGGAVLFYNHEVYNTEYGGTTTHRKFVIAFGPMVWAEVEPEEG